VDVGCCFKTSAVLSALFGDNWLSAIQSAKLKSPVDCLTPFRKLSAVRHTQNFTLPGMSAESHVLYQRCEITNCLHLHDMRNKQQFIWQETAQ